MNLPHTLTPMINYQLKTPSKMSAALAGEPKKQPNAVHIEHLFAIEFPADDIYQYSRWDEVDGFDTHADGVEWMGKVVCAIGTEGRTIAGYINARNCAMRGELGGAEEGVREGVGSGVVFGVEDAGVYSKWNINEFER